MNDLKKELEMLKEELKQCRYENMLLEDENDILREFVKTLRAKNIKLEEIGQFIIRGKENE